MSVVDTIHTITLEKVLDETRAKVQKVSKKYRDLPVGVHRAGISDKGERVFIQKFPEGGEAVRISLRDSTQDGRSRAQELTISFEGENKENTRLDFTTTINELGKAPTVDRETLTIGPKDANGNSAVKHNYSKGVGIWTTFEPFEPARSEIRAGVVSFSETVNAHMDKAINPNNLVKKEKTIPVNNIKPR